MPDITNIKGEDGGRFKSDGQSFTTTGQADYGLGFLVILDTVLTSLAMDGWGGTESELVGATLVAGTYIPGLVTELTVSAGLIAVLNH